MYQHYWKFGLILFIVFVFRTNTDAQHPEDFQSWNMFVLTKKINTNYTASMTTIGRLDQNATTFNDVSIDYRIVRRLTSGFNFQLSFRTWTFVDDKPIYFLWLELVHLRKIENAKWVNLLRLHNGLDWVGKEQADFLRWRNYFFYNIGNKKLSPYVGYDLWYRFNKQNQFQRIWLEGGLEYPLDKMKFRLNYRRIGFLNDGPGLRRNILGLNMFVTI